MDFTQNYFELLDLPQQYSVDKKRLSENYRRLQREFHPDRFASQSSNEQRLAVQFAAYINSAYQALQSSVLRAEYLLTLVGKEVDHQTTTVSDGAFLMLQMEWRETLADIAQVADVDVAEEQLESLEDTVKHALKEAQSDFESMYAQQDYDAAMKVVAKLHFIEKMSQEIEHRAAALFDE